MTLLGWAAALAGVYGALLGLLWFTQERLIFLPEPLPAEHRFAFGPDVHEVWVPRGPVRLHALHLRLPLPDGVVFVLHGNAGNLDAWFGDVELYRRANLDLFMLDYRGYGKSGGRITSQRELMADVRAAWRQVMPAYAGRKRILMGRSLGSGPAALLASEQFPHLTVLVSPYRSVAAMAADHYPFVPRGVLQRLLRYPLQTDEVLPALRSPVLLVHGERDEVIPVRHAEALAALAPRARFVRVPDAGHNDLDASPLFRQTLLEAFAATTVEAPR